MFEIPYTFFVAMKWLTGLLETKQKLAECVWDARGSTEKRGRGTRLLLLDGAR